MGKKSRRVRGGTTAPAVRTPAQRAEQVATLKRRLLDEYQLDDRVPAIARLYALMDAFEREGASASGSLPLEGSNKRIHYALCNRASAPCRVHLQVDRGGRAPTTA